NQDVVHPLLAELRAGDGCTHLPLGPTLADVLIPGTGSANVLKDRVSSLGLGSRLALPCLGSNAPCSDRCDGLCQILLSYTCQRVFLLSFGVDVSTIHTSSWDVNLSRRSRAPQRAIGLVPM